MSGSPEGRLQGRRIVVTGGGSGIGQAGVLQFAKEGAHVVIGDKRLDIAKETEDLVRKAGGCAIAVECDVSDEDQVKGLVEAGVVEYGGLDGLFANAGTAGAGWIHELTLEDWDRILRINLTGVFLAAKHTIPHIMEAGGGTIVTTGSIASVVVGGGRSAASYAASKGGVLQLTKQIAVDYGNQGIRANCICPGAVITNLPVHAGEDRKEQSTPISNDLMPRPKHWTPLPRMAESRELGTVAAFLMSEESSFITGTAMMVDGGLTAI
jgi:3-oxoacyl-[acyl-carrier protein] reductase